MSALLVLSTIYQRHILYPKHDDVNQVSYEAKVIMLRCDTQQKLITFPTKVTEVLMAYMS